MTYYLCIISYILGLFYSIWILKEVVKEIVKCKHKGIPIDIALTALIFIIVPGIIFFILSTVGLIIWYNNFNNLN